MMTKLPWQSKTLLVNGVALSTLVSSYYSVLQAEISGWLNDHSPEIAIIIAFINLILRWVTKDKISLSIDDGDDKSDPSGLSGIAKKL